MTQVNLNPGNAPPSGLRKYLNPLLPESGHKMLLHAQYIIIVSEMFTTKGSLKDLHTEGIKS